MARGGYRPGAGRPKMTEAEKAERRALKAAGLLPVAKKAPAKTEAPKKVAKRVADRVVHQAQADAPAAGVPADIVDAAKLADMSPLDYMLQVMRTPGAEAARRDRMAIAAAPFVHARREPVGQGKREKADELAKAAGAGKYGVRAAPKLVSSR